MYWLQLGSKQVAEEVFEVTGRNPKIDIALELERIALSDEYFIKRKLYPNVDFYSGIIYQAMGFTPDQFTVLFGIPRTVGWLAQWQEMLQDPERKIADRGHRPRDRQAIVGCARRGGIRHRQRGRRDSRLSRAYRAAPVRGRAWHPLLAQAQALWCARPVIRSRSATS